LQTRDALFLLLLSAIWGASFLFMRIASPEFGPVALVFVRMFGAVLAVLPLLLKSQIRQRILQNVRELTTLGVLNHVIPFCLLSFATLRLEAGFTSLINATTPMFTAIVGALWFMTPINKQQILGLVVAFSGVFILSADKLTFTSNGTGWAIIAGLVATFCYGMSVNYSKKNLSHLSASEITIGSMAASATILFIPAMFLWPDVNPSTTAWVSALLLAVVCTALAFLLFFKVLANSGAMASSTVTFLVPIFAIGWGVVLLDEGLSLRLILGMTVTLTGTAITLQLLRWRMITGLFTRQLN